MVGRWSMTPATKYGRVSRLLAYAQAADQHVWSSASAFMGRVCGVLLTRLRTQRGAALGHGLADMLGFRPVEAGGVRALHRACPMPRHATALLNDPPRLVHFLGVASGQGHGFKSAAVDTPP